MDSCGFPLRPRAHGSGVRELPSRRLVLNTGSLKQLVSCVLASLSSLDIPVLKYASARSLAAALLGTLFDQPECSGSRQDFASY